MRHVLHAILAVLVTYVWLYLSIVLVLRAVTTRVVFASGRIVRVRFRAWLPRWFGHDAVTVFGTVWVADRTAPADLLAHEYRHTMQERWLGFVLYLPVYYTLMARARSYYRDAMEADARAWARAHACEFTALEAT
jgi:hypothetical protein